MTVDRRFVKPREGYAIRDPYTKERIPAEGALVVTTGGYGTTIQKALNSGDLIECEPPSEELFQDSEEVPPYEAPQPDIQAAFESPRNALRRRTQREAAVDQRHADGVSSDAREPSEKGDV